MTSFEKCDILLSSMLDYWSLESLLAALVTIGSDCEAISLSCVTIDTRIYAHNLFLEETEGKSEEELLEMDSLTVSAYPNAQLSLLLVVKALSTFFEINQRVFDSDRSYYLEGIQKYGETKYRLLWGS